MPYSIHSYIVYVGDSCKCDAGKIETPPPLQILVRIRASLCSYMMNTYGERSQLAAGFRRNAVAVDRLVSQQRHRNNNSSSCLRLYVLCDASSKNKKSTKRTARFWLATVYSTTCVCSLHIKQLFLLVDIQHTQHPSMPTLRRREIQARFGHPRKTEIIHCDAVRTVDNVMPCSTSLPDTTSTTYTPATKIHWKIKNERQRTEEKIKRNGETAEAIIHQDSVHDTDRKEHQQADVKCPVHEARWKRNENSKCYPDQFPLSGGFPQRESMTSSFFNCLQ